jgi:pimeloyl-ACP methyl ester carboxylesterase
MAAGRDTEAVMATRRTVVRDGVELAVFEGGNADGPTVVMVHGWPDTHRMWLGVAALLAADFRVVAYDTRGQGQSGTVAPDSAFTLDELAADFFAVVDAVSPDAPVHVLGHDWGSVQVWEAVCQPGADERVASFTSMSGPNLDHVAAWVRRTLRRPTPRGVAEVVAQAVSSSYVPFFVSPIAPPVLGLVAGRERWRHLLRAVEGRPPATDGVADSVRRDMVSGLRYYRANAWRAGGRLRERVTTVPVLQLVLTRDAAVRPGSLVESERWVDDLQRREIPYGHWVALTHPEVVAREVARFVRSVETTRAA